VEVVRKDIKNLHLAVYPPHGRVRVAVPLRTSNETVRLAVVSRLGWIRRQQSALEKQERQSKREMVTGESHFVAGRRYRLDVFERAIRSPQVIQRGKTLELHVPPGMNNEYRENLLLKWYRRLLREQIPDLLAKWEPIVGLQVASCGIKRMKTRWGTCNIEARRI
jgi:predicted metal-dependent hydrolase